MKNGGGGSKREPRVIKQPIASRVLDLPRAAEYVGLTPTALAGMVHRGALPVIRYPGLRPWAGAGSKMYFDIQDLNEFVDINRSMVTRNSTARSVLTFGIPTTLQNS